RRHLACGEAQGGLRDAFRTLVLHSAAAAALAVSPRPGRAGIGRRASISSGAADRGKPRQRDDGGGSALRRAARDGRRRAAQRGVPRYASREVDWGPDTGSPLWAADTAQESWFHGGGRALAGARYWRQHGDLQPGGRRPA